MTMTTNFVPIKSDKFDFYISKYQITMREYLTFANETHSHYPEWMEKENKYNIETGSDDLYEEANFEDDAPIIGISWEDAKAYCAWLSLKDAKNYRLPTEIEWEYACRANTITPYSCQEDEVNEHAWYFDNALGEAHVVASKKPNPWGLYDMHGNVWEWCEDVWQETYYMGVDESYANNSEKRRVLRGGSWFDMKENATCSARHKYDLDFRYVDVGFRLLLTS